MDKDEQRIFEETETLTITTIENEVKRRKFKATKINK
jgi:hypothetical protein